MKESRVDIFDNQSRRLIGVCHGPTLAGTCTKRPPTTVVACAGGRISELAAGPAKWLLYVPSGSRHCPLAADLEIS